MARNALDNAKCSNVLHRPVTVHIIFIFSFRRKVFSIIAFFLLYNNDVHSFYSSVLSLAFTPRHFEAHHSSLKIEQI